MKPFPYQDEGADWLARVGRGLLADEMGLGKTVQAILGAVRAGARVCLVLCPASLVLNWRREIARWDAGSARRWHVVSYDMARRDAPFWSFLADLCVDTVICDEAHYLKGRDSQRTQVVFGEKCDGVGGLIERSERVFLLTGTPMPNNPSELWPMLRAVMPETIPNEKRPDKPMAFTVFCGRYCSFDRSPFGRKINGARKRTRPELENRLKPRVLRRKKADVLKDLPPIRFDVLPLPSAGKLPTLPPEEQAMVERALAEKGVEGLKAIAEHVATLRRLTGLAKVEPTVRWVRDWQEAGGDKIVLFCQHTAVADELARAFKTEAVSVTGATPSDKRQAPVDRFQNDPACRVFIGQIQAAGAGLTLTAASDLLFVESSWVPTDNQQAAARIHRIGQNRACTVRVATLAGSIDERIQEACVRKLADIRAIFG